MNVVNFQSFLEENVGGINLFIIRSIKYYQDLGKTHPIFNGDPDTSIKKYKYDEWISILFPEDQKFYSKEFIDNLDKLWLERILSYPLGSIHVEPGFGINTGSLSLEIIIKKLTKLLEEKVYIEEVDYVLFKITSDSLKGELYYNGMQKNLFYDNAIIDIIYLDREAFLYALKVINSNKDIPRYHIDTEKLIPLSEITHKIDKVYIIRDINNRNYKL